jgi:hypothetical protein
MDASCEARHGAAMRAIDAAGLSRAAADPPQIQLLRRLGFAPRRPHFAAFSTNFLAHGPPFALVWGLGMWLLAWRGAVPAAPAAVAAVLAGIAFGLAVALLYRGTAERRGLPRWEGLPAAPTPAEKPAVTPAVTPARDLAQTPAEAPGAAGLGTAPQDARRERNVG